MLELLKVMVQPVVIERDPDGQITGEKLGETVALFNADGISEYVEALRDSIAQANAGRLQGAPDG